MAKSRIALQALASSLPALISKKCTSLGSHTCGSTRQSFSFFGFGEKIIDVNIVIIDIYMYIYIYIIYTYIYITSLTWRVADVLVLLTPMMNRARAGVLRCKGTNLILSDCTSFGLRSRSYFYGFLKHGSRLSLLSKATAQQVGVDLCVGVHACVRGRRFGHGKYNPAGIESELLDNAVLTDVHACVRVGRARGCIISPPVLPPSSHAHV